MINKRAMMARYRSPVYLCKEVTSKSPGRINYYSRGNISNNHCSGWLYSATFKQNIEGLDYVFCRKDLQSFYILHKATLYLRCIVQF